MFTGIVQCISQIILIKKKKHSITYVIELPSKMMKDLQVGYSIANNGCCLTVTKVKKNFLYFDIIKETLKVTNLGKLKVGDKINIERAVKLKDEIGGHLMTGHIMTTAKIYNIKNTTNNYEILFYLKKYKLMKYILKKGFIGIDGISLTINKVYKNKFSVNLIPKTLSDTTIGIKKVGDIVNIEIDYQTQLIVHSVERILKNNLINKNV